MQSIGCKSLAEPIDTNTLSKAAQQVQMVKPGVESPSAYLPLLKGKKIAGVFNQSSVKGSEHLVDFLIKNDVKIEKIFALEHGFRGEADAGAKVDDDKDLKTGISIVSLYGNKKKPSKSDLKGIDVVVFDIQDVGVRFYTFISTLHYIMEACAENNIPLIVLDRPNPNAHYVDGPILEPDYKSFVGMHEVPTVYGMTIGEYGLMIKGEQWINKAKKCNIIVIPCKYYTHQSKYPLPVKPSPNLPNYRSILLYPSICFFEGTSVSVGRGTNKQFQCLGHPKYTSKSYTFTPEPMPGAMKPKLEGELCYGNDLSTKDNDSLFNQKRLDIGYLLSYHKDLSALNVDFFTSPEFFDKLAGTDKFRKQIIKGESEETIRTSWQKENEDFMKIRKKYLLYP